MTSRRFRALQKAQDTRSQAAVLLEEIAKQRLGVETLRPRRSDALDFHELGVWQLRAALEAAYLAGIEVERRRRARTFFIGLKVGGKRAPR